jgi:hypothetical protein
MPETEELKAKYLKFSDEQLQWIMTHPTEYRPEALRIAEACLLLRGIAPQHPEIDWTDIAVPRAPEADVEDASLGLKICFFLLPGIGWLVITVLFLISLAGKADRRIAQSIPVTVAGTVVWGLALWLFRMVTLTDLRA